MTVYTRKHYERTAKIIGETLAEFPSSHDHAQGRASLFAVMAKFEAEFEADNSRFDAAVFRSNVWTAEFRKVTGTPDDKVVMVKSPADRAR